MTVQLPLSEMARRLFWLTFVVAFVAGCSHEVDAASPPIVVPFSLNPSDGGIRLNLVIREFRSYSFNLRFNYSADDSKDRARLRTLLGGYQRDAMGHIVEPGVPTPVKLKIEMRLAGATEIVHEREVDPPLSSWGGDYFAKLIDAAALEPGSYVVTLVSLSSPTALLQEHVFLGIGINPKASYSK